MRHVIFGGDGFVGRHLAAMLVALGEEVIVGDIARTAPDIYDRGARFLNVDITDPRAFERIPLEPDDMVYNLAAKMLSPIMPRAKRRAFFWPVNYDGTVNILQHMARCGSTKFVHFTTDMVYGHAVATPQAEDAPVVPLGEYGLSKLETERLCEDYRVKGIRISIFRPRLIIGPGRLGILVKLFRLIDANLPVPLIGNGRNQYQFVSVFDCAHACICAWRAGVPNSEFNLGSDNPPSIRELLHRLIREAGSRSVLLPTPAPLVKLALTFLDQINRPLMDPEQYLIADEICILDTTRAKSLLGWSPQHGDEEMLLAAYREYRSDRLTARRVKSSDRQEAALS